MHVKPIQFPRHSVNLWFTNSALKVELKKGKKNNKGLTTQFFFVAYDPAKNNNETYFSVCSFDWMTECMHERLD